MEFVGPLALGICLAIAIYMLSPICVVRRDGKPMKTYDIFFMVAVFVFASVSLALLWVWMMRSLIPWAQELQR